MAHRSLAYRLSLCIACATAACGDDDAARGDASASRPCGDEVCDAEHRDEDCDPTTVGERDLDGDGASDARCCNRGDDGGLHCGDDCHDLQASVHPGAGESCDGLDNDCDGRSDEGVEVDRFRDADGDGHGAEERVVACAGEPGTAETDDDCDDADATVHPDMPELCDNRDNDCNGMAELEGEARDVVWYLDADNDGFGVTGAPVGISCAPPPFPVLCLDWLSPEFCAPGNPQKLLPVMENKIAQHHQEGTLVYALVPGDCDDIDPLAYPGAEERCNGHDDDCDGRADYRLGTNDFEDDDADGVIDASCERRTQDCDDMDATSGPKREEICDAFDNDCDGAIDESVESTAFYVDRDGDGHGDASREPIRGCSAQGGRAANGDDCDDRDALRHPGRAELCDAVDQDCDARIDELLGGCGMPSRVTGVVARADDAAQVIAGARVTAYDIYGAVLDREDSRSSGHFDLEVPAGPVVVSVQAPADSGLVGVTRALIAPVARLEARLDGAARWDAIAAAAGVERDPARGLFVAELDGATPAGGQGVLLAPGGGRAVARAGEITQPGATLPAYGPPLTAPAGEPFASVSHFELEPGLYNPMLTEVIACQPYAVSALVTGMAPASRILRVVSFPVLPNAITLLRVDCSAGLDTCCSAWGLPGCSDRAVETCVCAQRPSCCEQAWDATCAELVSSGGCSTCSQVIPRAGACCSASDVVGCAIESVAACVCRVRPECCAGPWHENCAGALSSLRCGYCPGGGLSGVPFGAMGLDAGAGN